MESEGPSIDVGDFDTLNTYPINTMDGEPNMKLVKNIRDFKELQPYWNFKGEQMLLHFDANMKHGGVVMRDHDGVVPQAIKDILKKVAGKIATGKLADMSTIAQPAYLHHYIT